MWDNLYERPLWFSIKTPVVHWSHKIFIKNPRLLFGDSKLFTRDFHGKPPDLYWRHRDFHLRPQILSPKLFVLTPNFHRFTLEPPRSLQCKLGVSNEKFEVSTETLSFPWKSGGSKTKRLRSPTKSLGSPVKFWGLRSKARGLRWKLRVSNNILGFPMKI